MVELEADDALASAAYIAMADARVERICIWTPDKDLAQCVVDDRVVQMDRRAGKMRNAEAIIKKYGVNPVMIPDYLALVGDSADGYPGIDGIGKVGAAKLINKYGQIENFPANLLEGQSEKALLFKKLATLRTDAPLFTDIDQILWKGPRPSFAEITEKMKEPRLFQRVGKLVEKFV
jgi:5'-3' exonuclease